MNEPRLLLITTFGLGRLRPASGTWGSLPPVILAAGLIAVHFGPGEHPAVFNLVQVATILVFSWACFAHGDQAEALFGKKDPGQVVADETAGQAIALLFIPAAAVATPLAAAGTLLLAFLAFRFFDITKIPPAYKLQRLTGGWGILVDDLVAGLYAFGLVQIFTRLVLPPLTL